MKFSFGDQELNVALGELRRGPALVPVEPQVFDLLVYLIRNRDRVVSKDDLIESVWGGRIISESTLTSRINAARKAVGDSGAEQRLIRTIARKGFRFIAEVREEVGGRGSAVATEAPKLPAAVEALPGSGLAPSFEAIAKPHRASIAVMPFTDELRPSSGFGGLADALARDIITRLAKLRTALVIAHATVLALHERGVSLEEAGRLLDVGYIASGSVRRSSGRLTVTVELSDVRSRRIVWADTFDRTIHDAFLILDEIGDSIVSAIASEIETNERNRAILKPPHSLDAWEAHHRGLWHAYRFNKPDNDRAKGFFEMAVGLDPTFSRAYAGLSFTHWQNAFQGWGERTAETERAYATAGQSVMVDDRDPAAHWALGRALWLRGLRDLSLEELTQAVDLSPNFAQGHYSLAFVHSQAGDALTAIASADHSRRLSPFDPMLFAMLGSRAMALARLGRFEEASDCAVNAAARPNAHLQILGIATYTLALSGRLDEARAHLARIHKEMPTYSVEDFLTAMRFDFEGEQLFREAAKKI